MLTLTNQRLLLRRFIAGIYDFFLLLGVWFLAGSFFLVLNSREILPPLLGLLIAFMSAWLFFGYFWNKSGQTLGMSVWKIKLVPFEGTTISLKASFLRLILVGCTFLSLGTLLLYSFIDKEGLTLADRLSKTKLIRL
ncbi:MAG: RDD family protein [Gammaproteobacteria bacterium]